MGKQLFWVLAIGYTIALAVVSLVDLKDMPSIGIEASDKLLHLLAYAGLTLLWYWAVKPNRGDRKLGVIVFGAIIYGIVLEVIQGKMSTERISDVLDIVANVAGVALATLYILYIRKSKVKN